MKIPALLCLVLAASAPAQIVYIENNNPAIGTSNTFPWAQANGFTTLHVYTAAQLTAGGVCPGAVLTGIDVAPSTQGAGAYNAPQARLSVGHLAFDPPIAGMWEANIASPTVIHDLTSGPYTFTSVVNTWSPLPGVAGSGFAWDGITSIAIFYTSSPGTTGLFNIHRTATNLRHAVTVFNATTQAPTSNGLFAMKVGLHFSGGFTYQVNQPGAALDLDGISSTQCLPAVVFRQINQPAVLTMTSTLAGNGYEVLYTVPEAIVPLGAGGSLLSASGQIVNVDLAAPGLGFLNGLAFPAFPGTFSIGIVLPFPFAFSAQLAVVDPANPDGFALSGPVRLVIQ
jgi:hypothetical protein